MGTFRLEIDKDTPEGEFIQSDKIEVVDMIWKGAAKKQGKYLKVYLGVLAGEYKIHRVVASMQSTIINDQNNERSISIDCDTTLDKKNGDFWSLPSKFNWDDMMNDEKGFIKNKKLTLLIKFSVTEIVGFRKRHPVDFMNPNEEIQDVVLIIGGEKIYVGKQILSLHSPVFKRMFFGDFKEKNQKEIKLEDINRKEFMELLDLMYHSYKFITANNYKFLLELSDRFEIDMVMDKVEQFLIADTDNEITIAAKLVLADRYRLLELQDHCLDQMTTIKSVTDLEDSKDSKNFTSSIKLALYDKIIKLSKQ